MVDHGILRLFYRNCFRLPGGFYRSNQPDPRFLRQMIRSNRIRTVVCLRGENDQHGWYRLEKHVCAELDVNFQAATVYSRGLLTIPEMDELRTVIEKIELPALIHCKSGADRAGYVSMLFRHYRLGEPLEQASAELRLRYGHFKGAKTGVLDYQIQCYLSQRDKRQSFREWLVSGFNRDVIQDNFRPWAGISWLVDRILKRE